MNVRPEQSTYCWGCEARHAPPVASHRGYRPNHPSAEKFCGCGHKIEDCAPERCSHSYAQDAMWGGT